MKRKQNPLLSLCIESKRKDLFSVNWVPDPVQTRGIGQCYQERSADAINAKMQPAFEMTDDANFKVIDGRSSMHIKM